jgi:beta-glucanase (GH16 family)
MFRLVLLLCAARHADCTAPPPPQGYVAVPALTDEFEGSVLDASKWTTNVGWQGRQPALFEPSNVEVAGGMLQLWARAAKRNASWPAGYDNITTAAVKTVATVKEGLFQIRWRSGSSGISSSWWFTGGNSTAKVEIDVFESTGVAAGGGDPSSPDWCPTTPLNKCRTGCPPDPHGRCGPDKQPFPPHGPSCNMCPCNRQNTTCGMSNNVLASHVHIWEFPDTPIDGVPAKCGCVEGTKGKAPCSKGNTSLADTAFSAQFHIATLNWTATEVTVAVDGVVMNTITSPCMVVPINMWFDRETMPDWMAMPTPGSLPDQPFEIDYVRTWRRINVAHPQA